MKPEVTMGLAVACVAVFGMFNRAMLPLSCASAIAPVRPLAGTLLKPAPLPLNIEAVTGPANVAPPLSKATLEESRASGLVPLMFVAATAFALLAAPALAA